jgi:hypothetical protein
MADEPAGGDMKNMDMKSMDMSAMMKPGPEAMALAKFFKGTATWKGDIAAGSMGPNSPATTSHGTAVCRQEDGGMWYTCDVQDMVGSGKDAMTWKGHMVISWDAAGKAYRSYCADNLGTTSVWTGRMDGDNTFVLETDQPINSMGQTYKDRLTWVLNGDGTAKFTDEHQMQGSSDWTAFESATAKMTGGMKMSSGKAMSSK